MYDSSLPFVGQAAFDNQKQVFNHATDWNALVGFEQARHWPSRGDTLVRVLAHRRNVVRDYHPPGGRPSQDHWIIRPRQVYVLNTDDVNVRFPPNQPANDIVVEVLVGRKSQHWPEWLSAAREEPVPNVR